MRRSFLKTALRSWRCRRHHQPILTTALRGLSTVQVASGSAASYDIDTFRKAAFTQEKPFHFKNDGGIHGDGDRSLPAARKWFSLDETSSPAADMTLSPYLVKFSDDAPFPYELYSPPPSSADSKSPVAAFCEWLSRSEDFQDQILAGILHAITAGGPGGGAGEGFFQLQAPLQLLAKALLFNRDQVSTGLQPLLLYVAQSSVSDLPQPLQADLPTPSLVRKSGKGDVYGSSIWIGTEPTYTPLHRDPNPNLFCQLHSQKVIRLLPPQLGERIFFEVQTQLRRRGGGSSRMRGTEMMEGTERALLYEAVWADGKLADKFQQAELDTGDSLFIPKGWWHSVKSIGSSGALNASVNWWFR
ncbi:JmjC domain protein [Geosmithia morbida]|uniref:JmjC domain protein n=1 Tax=Geosmithia morbida TaxID=1094350 RepID=A0A9P5D3N3_9HYPO|nr:JmjC domain protein [Geosmithia morbida]KAF4122701.1 JmjC domain protein [Geosmithia morbida]